MGDTGRRLTVSDHPAKNLRLYLKNNLKAKRPGSMVQVIECLPGKCK
jgi:hypothetical protein